MLGNKIKETNPNKEKSINKIKDPQNIMDRGIDTIIMIKDIIVPTTIEGIGDHGENGMIIEGTILTHTKTGDIIEKIIISILNLKPKMVALYFLSESNIYDTQKRNVNK